MKHFWINNSPATNSVILFFLGWGADERCLANMPTPPFNAVAFFDYDSLDTDVCLDSYSDINVIAWSMGVYNAECFLQANNIKASHKTAIAGTCTPIHATLGLLPDVCQGTLDNWADATRRKFSMRMCGGRQAFADLLSLLSTRSVDNQKEELSSIMRRAESLPVNDVLWDKAIISTQDLIFLPDNQRRYWDGHASSAIEMDIPHFPFGSINNWEILI